MPVEKQKKHEIWTYILVITLLAAWFTAFQSFSILLPHDSQAPPATAGRSAIGAQPDGRQRFSLQRTQKRIGAQGKRTDDRGYARGETSFSDTPMTGPSHFGKPHPSSVYR